MTMDVLTEFFEFGSSSFIRLHRLITMQILEEAAEQGVSMAVTSGWRFDEPTETAFNLALGEPFLNRGGRVYYVELWAPLDVRLLRNLTHERSASKKTEWATSEYLVRLEAEQHRDSGGTLPLDTPFLRLETAKMTATEAAEAIVHYMQTQGPSIR
jgi:hypothetical protein